MFHPDTDIIILQPGAIVDGKRTYTHISARGRVMDFSRRDFDCFGRVSCGKIVLIAPPEVPDANARLLIDGEYFDLKSVKICRNLSGELVGCRCVVAGGTA